MKVKQKQPQQKTMCELEGSLEVTADEGHKMQLKAPKVSTFDRKYLDLYNKITVRVENISVKANFAIELTSLKQWLLHVLVLQRGPLELLPRQLLGTNKFTV